MSERSTGYDITFAWSTTHDSSPFTTRAAGFWLCARDACQECKPLLCSLLSHERRPWIEGCARLLWPGRKAVVILQEVHSPFSKHLGVLHLMPKACRKLCTCHAARIAVHTELQPCGIITGYARPLMCLPTVATLLAMTRSKHHLQV